MRLLIILFFGLTLLNSCGNSNEENNVKSPVDELIESDSIIGEKITYGVIANLGAYDSDEKIVLPLYRTKNLITAEDSIFIIPHSKDSYDYYLKSGKNELILPKKEEYFTFFDKNNRKSALVFESNNDSAFQVLGKKYWISKSDFQEGFEVYSWDEFFDEIDMAQTYIVPLNENLKYFTDTSLVKAGGKMKKYDEVFGTNIIYEQGLFSLNVQEIISREYEGEWGQFIHYSENEVEKRMYLNPVNNGEPKVKLVQNPFQTHRFFEGIGMITGAYTTYNLYARSPNLIFRDSLLFYDKPNGRISGFIPVVNNSLFIYGARELSDTVGYMYLGGRDINSGMASMEYIKVYEKKGSWVRVFRSVSEENPIWIDLNDLPETHGYLTWNEYFEKFPEGNDGWEKGYAWVGGLDFLYAAPSEGSARILEFPLNVSIFLEGDIRGKWAKVEVKEVRHVFNNGERYSGEDRTFNVWTGWIRMTNAHGYPNLEEIILGC